MATIKEILAKNLRRIRGNRNQPDMATALGLPPRTYARLELAENLPQEGTFALLTAKLGISEIDLVRDPDAHPRPTLLEALGVIQDELGIEIRLPRPQSVPSPRVAKPATEDPGISALRAVPGALDAFAGATPNQVQAALRALESQRKAERNLDAEADQNRHKRKN